MGLIFDLICEIIDDLMSKFVMENSKMKPCVKIAVAVGVLCVPLAGCGFIMYIGLSGRDWLSFVLGLGSLLALASILLYVMMKRITEHRDK